MGVATTAGWQRVSTGSEGADTLVSRAEPAPDAAGEFVAWVGPHLVRMSLLAARMAPAVDRDDLVQEALLRAWRHRRSFDPARGQPSAWLLAIVANVCRRESGRHSRLRSVGEPPDLAQPPTGVGPDRAIDLERAVATLPKRQRLAVDCYYFAGLTVTETAAVMGCSDGTVKSALSGARRRLRILLEDNDGR